MKQFFKITFASALGFVLGSVLLTFLSVAIIAGIISSIDKGDKNKEVKENSILKFTFSNELVDRASNNPLENFDFNTFESRNPDGLNDILKAIDKAKEDENIKGIYLELTSLKSGMAAAEEIRAKLLDFKESGKFITAYGEGFTQGAYYLASVADDVYLFPEGDIEFYGLRTELAYLKGMLDKFDIEMQVIRGKNNKFKSAVEPFMYDKMTDANREQITLFLDAFWSNMLQGISTSRGISVDELNLLADELKIRKAKDALTYSLVDGLKYYDEMEKMLKERMEVEEDDDLEFISFSEYKNAPKPKKKDDSVEKPWEKKESVAVIYAAGEIRSGKSDAETLGSETIAKAIKEAAEDSTIKAIVLRVNSPGGSALASEVIWRETIRAKEKKPFVVSMGNLAASGGYYISAAADKIYADETTITGSIGVFGLIPNVGGLMNKQLGINFERVNTNKNSDMFSFTKSLSPTQFEAIQESVEDIYNTFLSHVAEGRGMSIAQVDSIGQGRVWAGRDALKIGLIDEIGGLESAIAYAAEQAGMEDYKVKDLPKQEDPMKQFLKELGMETKATIGTFVFGEEYKYLQLIEKTKNQKGILAKMPFEMEIYW